MNGTKNAALTGLYGLTLFVSAFLLFWIEPLLGKLLLPVFGGTPATWNICLIFYQAALLGGYLYAHGLASRISFGIGATLHIVFFAAIYWILPLSLKDALSASQSGIPAFQILRMLALAIGAPFVLLSATSSLLQSWYGSSSLTRAQDPYFLYAASNAGSLLALLIYPWAIEPFFSTHEQWHLWKRAYVALALLIGACAWGRARNFGSRPVRRAFETGRTELSQVASWIFWSFVPSSLLLGVTTYLSTDIIAVPLLWVVPLVLYLAVFIAVFARPQWARLAGGWLPVRALCLGAMLCLLGIALDFSHPAWVFLPLHLGVFTLACVVCLGRAAVLRPATVDLTRYYLWISLGGMLGGIFNGLLAPVFFREISEYPLMMIVACLCRPASKFSKWDILAPLYCGALMLVPDRLTVMMGLPAGQLTRFLVLGPAALLCYRGVKLPTRYGLGLAILYFGGTGILAHQGQELLYRSRSFYGTLKVLAKKQESLIFLVHGSTAHGAQSTNPLLRKEPLTYYSRTGPAGEIFAQVQGVKRDAHIGVIGLGTGTLAAYAKLGEQWTFFELDPNVLLLAQGPGSFTYLQDAAVSPAIVLGDARLKILEAPDHSFDLLVLDAFSSDSVPAHLLTREALNLYLSKLAPGGVLAFHISNRFLRLAPVVGAVAADVGAVAWVRSDTKRFGEGIESGLPGRGVGESASIWAVAARNDRDLGGLTRGPRWKRLTADPRFAWQDDFYDLIGLIRW